MTAASVAAFNALPEGEALAALQTCLHSTDWASAVLGGRPYPDRESLLATAYRFGLALDDAGLESALSKHPRIGERPTGASADAEHSRREQGGVDAADAELTEALLAGNVAYEERFGRVFLIRAAGRSGHDILEALHQRLTHDDESEAVVVRDQLAQIAQLRLEALLKELDHPIEEAR
ncbi:2-oxo-4-hydroxy-4-carboxy-5-ureidoimidazoline decarboxylase [Spongisporangium articulatum]|uniref:2-oxo-4-hydroxy-4-carboxy-5-ureidoimidazoline decarboxylase n=1 Tax=Spongisporangium articulatum TaxID=3362603 RepID=A0ABW8AH02_9ACTN